MIHFLASIFASHGHLFDIVRDDRRRRARLARQNIQKSPSENIEHRVVRLRYRRELDNVLRTADISITRGRWYRARALACHYYLSQIS